MQPPVSIGWFKEGSAHARSSKEEPALGQWTRDQLQLRVKEKPVTQQSVTLCINCKVAWLHAELGKGKCHPSTGERTLGTRCKMGQPRKEQARKKPSRKDHRDTCADNRERKGQRAATRKGHLGNRTRAGRAPGAVALCGGAHGAACPAQSRGGPVHVLHVQSGSLFSPPANGEESRRAWDLKVIR